jgi:hypothetical protein
MDIVIDEKYCKTQIDNNSRFCPCLTEYEVCFFCNILRTAVELEDSEIPLRHKDCPLHKGEIVIKLKK